MRTVALQIDHHDTSAAQADRRRRLRRRIAPHADQHVGVIDRVRALEHVAQRGQRRVRRLLSRRATTAHPASGGIDVGEVHVVGDDHERRIVRRPQFGGAVGMAGREFEDGADRGGDADPVDGRPEDEVVGSVSDALEGETPARLVGSVDDEQCGLALQLVRPDVVGEPVDPAPLRRGARSGEHGDAQSVRPDAVGDLGDDAASERRCGRAVPDDGECADGGEVDRRHRLAGPSGPHHGVDTVPQRSRGSGGDPDRHVSGAGVCADTDGQILRSVR